MTWLQALLPGMVAALVTMLLTSSVAKLAVRVQAVDVPGGRKRHEGVTPRLGGIAIVAGIVAALIPGLLLLSGGGIRGISGTEVAWFTLAALIIFASGLADDIFRLRPFQKLLLQLLAASIVVALGWQFSTVRLPGEIRFYVGAVAPLLSVLWIVGVTNAINFIDGLDGLAAGIVAIIASSLMVLAILQRSPETVIATSCVAGACVGFLRYNWRPARIYMGDSGSLTLGFILAAISLKASVKASAAVALFIPILALGLPVIDTLLVMWYRFLSGHRFLDRIARMFYADRAHLHHLLLETRTQRSGVLFTLYGLAVACCVMALLVAASGSLILGVAFLGVQLGAVLLLRKTGLNAAARRLTDERLERIGRTLPNQQAESPDGKVDSAVEAAEPVTE